MIHEAKLDHSLRDAPVYIGGLSTKMTVVYDKFSGSTRRSAPDFKILRDMNPITGNRRGRRPIPLERGAIYALSSGMMTEKTTSNGFARGFIDKPGNMLLFVGYADPDSPGGKIRAAQAGDEIQLDPELPGVPLNCGVKVYDFSGHAPRNHLLDFMQTANAKKTVLVHGDPSALEWFEKQVEGAVVPASGRPLSL